MLLRLCLPFPDESLNGFITRLTEVNYYDSPRWILELAGMLRGGNAVNANLPANSTADLSGLSRISGIPAEVLRSLTFEAGSSSGTFLKINNTNISRFAVHRGRTKICPLCLSEASYSRKVWDISAVTSCPIHSCMLIDKCPGCGRTLRAVRRSTAECSCGYDLRSCTPVFTQTHLSRHIYQLCGILGSDEDQIGSSPIDGLELANLISLIFFTAHQNFKSSRKWTDFTVSRNNSMTDHELNAAFNVFSNWPISYFDFLENTVRRNSRMENKTGLERDFGQYYKILYRDFLNENFSFLRSAFEYFLAEHWDGGYYNSKIRAFNSKESKSFMAGTEAADFLNISLDQIRVLIQEGRIDGVIKQMGGRSLILARTSSINSFRKMLNSTISLEEAGRKLGISKKSVLNLVNNKCINPFRGPKADGFSCWLFHENAIDKFLKQVSDSVKMVPECREEGISFSESVRKLTSCGLSIGSFIRMVLSGEVSPIRKVLGKGLNKFIFSKEEIELITSSRLSEKKQDLLTVKDVSQMLGVKQEVAACWMDRNYVQCEIQPGLKNRRYTTHRAVTDFRQYYVVLSELACLSHTSPRHLFEELREKGVMPISGPSVDSGRQYLYKKIDIFT